LRQSLVGGHPFRCSGRGVECAVHLLVGAAENLIPPSYLPKAGKYKALTPLYVVVNHRIVLIVGKLGSSTEKIGPHAACSLCQLGLMSLSFVVAQESAILARINMIE